MLESHFSGEKGIWCLLEGETLLHELGGAPFPFCLTGVSSLQAAPMRSTAVLYPGLVLFSLLFLLKKAKLSRWGRGHQNWNLVAAVQYEVEDDKEYL